MLAGMAHSLMAALPARSPCCESLGNNATGANRSTASYEDTFRRARDLLRQVGASRLIAFISLSNNSAAVCLTPACAVHVRAGRCVCAHVFMLLCS